ncbi:hypothetical protein UPYG_G00128720 [Umbra pygmaea]|uniref:C-type lectin domain-containing protein n=1 Tax=Umbra pygmaea TaxID=75934 RepID=A0ABD0XA31_UMBPY
MQKTWTDSQNYCKQKHSSLAIVRNQTEWDELKEKLPSDKAVWIGLRKLPCVWWNTDNISSSYRNCSLGNKGQAPRWIRSSMPIPGTANTQTTISADDQIEIRPFICYNATTSQVQTTTPVTAQPQTTTTNITQPQTTTQVITQPQTTTTNITQPQTTTHVITQPQTTTTNITQPQTTTHVITQPQTTTTNITQPQTTTHVITQPQTTTTNFTQTQTTTTNITQTQTSTHVTTQPQTMTPVTSQPQTMTPATTHLETTEHPTLPCGPDELVLVNQNMTWSEALWFCRNQSMELVSVLNQTIQNCVEQRTSNASSPFIWLGLRYTCTLDFWFWVNGIVSCYENWAEGQGFTSSIDQCGKSGAIQKNGRKWSSLPENDRYNFICSKSHGF